MTEKTGKVCALLLICVCLAGVGSATLGATDESPNKSAASLAQTVLESDPAVSAPPMEQPPAVPDVEYTKVFSYEADVLFSGIYQSSSFFFSLEPYWDTRYAYAQIEFSGSPLIQDVPASLTFSVNGTPVSSCAVDYRLGKTQVAYVELPVSLLSEGFNEFAVSGFVRLYDDDGCLDDLSGANWVHITENSLVQAGYDLASAGDLLADYPYPFVSSVDETGTDCAIYVPEDADGGELAAALLLRADLGGETAGADEVELKTMRFYAADTQKRKIVVAGYSRIPQELAGAVDGNQLSGYGFAGRMADSSGNPVLLVTGQTEQGLYEAAAMLMDASRVSQEKQTVAFVAEGATEQAKQASLAGALVASEYTMEGITGGGLLFVGPFHQMKTLDLPVPGGFVLSEGGKVSLRFRYSDNLDFNRSLVTVYWGEVPMFSKKLQKENAQGDTLSFLLPADVAGTYAKSVAIAFDLELPDLYCTRRADQMPWAYVTGDSALYLPTGGSARYSFAARPYPFQIGGMFRNLCVVIPDRMTAAELDTLGQLLSLEGAGIGPYGTLFVVRASEFRPETTDADLILLGTYRDNPAIAALNDSLSFAYTDGGGRFSGNAQLSPSEAYAARIAVLQMIRSPYADNRGVLVAGGTDDAAVARIGGFLREEANRWKLSGDAFVIDGDMETRAFTFLSDIKPQKITLGEQLQQNKTAVIFTLVSTASMFLLLLAVLFVAIRARRRGKEETDS